MSMSVSEFIRIVGNKFFTVEFVKRTTGEVRVMNGRLRVQKHLKGGDKAYNFSEKNLVSVYDVQKRGYRAVPMESVIRLKAGGKVHEVSQG